VSPLSDAFAATALRRCRHRRSRFAQCRCLIEATAATAAAVRCSPQVTMSVAQQLYESGYITYMRTDNPNLSDEARALALECAERVYGAEHLQSGDARANKKPQGSQVT
jgi:DNA topoisomerase IA